MSKPFYSFGIIFKNEIRCLERCLKSLQPLRDAVSCEVVMADTGSTDGSREIAEKYADILIDFPWCDDFAAARNAVMDRCSGVWYFSIDADEWFPEDITELVLFSKTKAKIASHLGGIMIRNYKSLGADQETRYVDFCGIRLARLSTGARYEGCIHEHLVVPGEQSKDVIRMLKTVLNHDGYAYASNADMKAKHDRNIRLLEKKLKDDPDDLQTLSECIEATMQINDICMEYARRAVDIVRKKEPSWQRKGPTIYRNVVSAAKFHKMPELLEWAEEAVAMFPDSIFTRIDISYYMFSQSWDENDYASCVKWGEAYRAGMADYAAGNYDISEPLRGVLEYSAPYWERRLLILLADSYARLEQYDQAFSTLQKIDGSELDEEQQVVVCVNVLLRIHRMTAMDTASFLVKFWDEIQCPGPTEGIAEKRRVAFLSTATTAFAPFYRKDEASREGFKRHGYTIFIPLEGKCTLGKGAVIMDCFDPVALEKLLTPQDFGELPIASLAHALQCGMRFPLPGHPMSLKEMEILVGRLVPFGNLLKLADAAPQEDGNLQVLCWKQMLLQAAVRSSKWGDMEQGSALARAFSKIEKEFLPVCYANSVLTENGLFILPPIHRFGWYCAQAFDALDAGDTAGYVRLLREGLSNCEGMKDMAEFLLEHTPELQQPDPSAELLVLAQNVRMLLGRFPPGSPAVEEIKHTEVYQKVAHLIDGVEAVAFGGIKQ